jgi:hypothetical protein
MNYKKVINRSNIWVYLICAPIIILFVMTFIEYKGNGSIYLLFTLVSNTLLYFGFRKNALFFDTFIAVFFWLGFWLKLSYRVAFADGYFLHAVGSFDGAGQSFDHALLVTTCGLLGLLAASYIREKYIFKYPKKTNETGLIGLFQIYKKHRKLVLLGFLILFVFIAVTNAYFGIYQRGIISKVNLPYGLNGVYTWMLLFGGASFSALILHFEFILNKRTSYLVVFLSLLESFLSNVSLLSRGMIVNTSALVYGVIKSLRFYSIKSNYNFLITSFVLFLILFGSSVLLVNQLRYKFISESTGRITTATTTTATTTASSNLEAGLDKHEAAILRLLVDRWVGIEGVLAVSSYPKKGWVLWHDAWQEKFAYHENTFYDKYLIDSPYKNKNATDKHSVSMPGSLAYCFYPGSFLFLFFCMFSLGLIGVLIEISVYKLGGKNLILCALLAQVVAYRYAHFGYVPRQSFLLFGALYLNLFMFYFANKIIVLMTKKELSIQT